MPSPLCLCKMIQYTCASQQRANLSQRGNGGGDASKVGGGGVKKENKLKQEQRKKGQQYATHFFS